MSFFNKKEDVIELQLTQYGKHLLSKGKFKPTYYAFFDDDIIYDAEYAGVTETQNSTQDRIESTPILKTQYIFSSREKAVKELIGNTRSGVPTVDEDFLQESNERNYALISPLGTSEITSSKNPAWKINFLQGEINTASENISDEQIIRIPQITMETIEFNTEVKKDDLIPDPDLFYNPTGEKVQGSTSNAIGEGDQYLDGSYVKVTERYLLADVQELNSDFKNDNFDIEVFLVEEDTTGEISKLSPLKFIKRPSFMKNGILQDLPDYIPDDNFPAIDSTYVEYWFDIFCDFEIEQEILCANRTRSITKGGIFNQDNLKCEDDLYDIVKRDAEEEEC